MFCVFNRLLGVFDLLCACVQVVQTTEVIVCDFFGLLCGHMDLIIKDLWCLELLNPRRSSSLLWLRLLSPLVQIFPYHNTHLPIVSLVCC